MTKTYCDSCGRLCGAGKVLEIPRPADNRLISSDHYDLCVGCLRRVTDAALRAIQSPPAVIAKLSEVDVEQGS